jgi:hypothetical protein
LHFRDQGQGASETAINFHIPVAIGKGDLLLSIRIILKGMSRLSAVRGMREHIVKAKLARKKVLENMLGLTLVLMIQILIQNIWTSDP